MNLRFIFILGSLAAAWAFLAWRSQLAGQSSDQSETTAHSNSLPTPQNKVAVPSANADRSEPQAGNNGRNGTQHEQTRWTRNGAIWAMIYTVVTSAILGVGIWQAVISHESMTEGNKAYVIINKVQIITYGAPTDNERQWVVSAIIENTGNTPTKNLRICGQKGVGTREAFAMLKFFNWSSIDPKICVASVIGPKSEITDVGMRLGSDMVSKIDNGLGVEMWGAVLYDDIFHKPRRTEYCFSVLMPPVDFNTWPAGQPIRAQPEFCPEHNCADEDCSDYQGEKSETTHIHSASPAP